MKLMELMELITDLKNEKIIFRISNCKTIKEVDNLVGEFFLLHYETIMKTRKILKSSYGDVKEEDVVEFFLLVFYGCFQGKEMPAIEKRHIELLEKKGFQQLSTLLKEVDGKVHLVDLKEVYVALKK